MKKGSGWCRSDFKGTFCNSCNKRTNTKPDITCSFTQHNILYEKIKIITNAKMKELWKSSPTFRNKQMEYKWERDLRLKYNISKDDYDDMLNRHNMGCYICGTMKPNPSGRIKHFPIDHDHKTNEIRGLLCVPCNRSVGFVENLINMGLLNKILDYMVK